MTGLRIGRWFWFAGTLMLLAYGLHVALQVVPADAEQGNVGRILYYHVPTWVATCVCFLTNLAASLVYLGLRHRNSSAALRADAVLSGYSKAARAISRDYGSNCLRHASSTLALSNRKVK
jgi:ABC-type transport system involved in cytochrome c biogenesis permease subunit